LIWKTKKQASAAVAKANHRMTPGRRSDAGKLVLASGHSKGRPSGSGALAAGGVGLLSSFTVERAPI